MMEIIHGLNKESVISVEGTVRERSSKNKNLPTGEVEVLPERIEVLGKCRYNELPFQIGRSREADETLRLKHRYLDLRNPEGKPQSASSSVASWTVRSIRRSGLSEP